MEGIAAIAIFVAVIACVAVAIVFAVRGFKNRRSERPLDSSDMVTLSEAARIAYRQAIVERLAIAGSTEFRHAPEGAVAWFERSIREVVPATNPEQANKVSRAELTQYMRWARSVQ